MRNSVLIRLALSESLSDLSDKRESISSIKIIAGVFERAVSKSARISFSDSPTHFETRSDVDTVKKVELLASVAVAFARNDLPVPGGP